MEKMREIKFRAWDNRLKYMISPEYGNWISFDGVPYEEAVIKYNTPHTEIEKSKDLILMQFTGLKDKNGIEIYEGDIDANWGIVEWNELRFRWDMIKGNNRNSMKDLFANNYYHPEIIGNIYSNPELLNSQPN